MIDSSDAGLRQGHKLGITLVKSEMWSDDVSVSVG